MPDTISSGLQNRYDGASIASLIAGASSLVALQFSPLAVVVSIAAVILALVSRSHLRKRPELRGARASVGGFILGSIGLALTGVPFLLSVILQLLAASH